MKPPLSPPVGEPERWRGVGVICTAVNALMSLWMWLLIAGVAVLGFLIQLPLALLMFPFDRRRYVAGRFFRWMGIAVAKLSPYWHFGVQGALTVPQGPTVVVSNHESQADPFLISFLPWEMKWLGKAILFKVPFVGWSMWLAGDIPIHRGTSTSAKGAMGRCAEWLDRGMPVMIFPEGTRSTGEDLLPFKDGAFRLAIEKGAALLPIAVHGTRRALPKHSWRFQQAIARVSIGTPIPTSGLSLSDVEHLKSLAREQIVQLRTELRRALAQPAP